MSGVSIYQLLHPHLTLIPQDSFWFVIIFNLLMIGVFIKLTRYQIQLKYGDSHEKTIY